MKSIEYLALEDSFVIGVFLVMYARHILDNVEAMSFCWWFKNLKLCFRFLFVI